MRMTSMVLVLVAAAQAACGGSNKPATAPPAPVAPAPPPAPAPAPPLDDTAQAHAFREEMCACTTKACADDVSARLDTWGRGLEDKYQVPKDVPEALMQEVLAMAACEDRYSGEVVPVATPPSAVPSGPRVSTTVPECDEYLDVKDRYFGCDQVPQQAKAAVRLSFEQQKQAWALLRDPNVPQAAKLAAAEGCKQGTEALRESAAAAGCTL